jgi:Na+-translocating ferredoxin:NAD+ oxidoreductase subunit B
VWLASSKQRTHSGGKIMIEAIILMLVMGTLLGFGLAVSGEIFYVKPDERFEKVLNMLPGYNCGACGYPGCQGMAEGLLSGEVTAVSQCKPSNAQQRTDISGYLNENPGPDGKVLVVKP